MLSSITRFVLVGLTSTLVHVITAYGLTKLFDLGVQTSNIIGFTSAFLLSFIGHQKYTFRVSDQRFKRILRFFCTSSAGLLTSSSILYITTTHLMLPVEVGFIAIVCIVPVATYLISLRWVFKPTAN